jgi:hypothetical protein
MALNTIDDEWSQFISNNYNNDTESDAVSDNEPDDENNIIKYDELGSSLDLNDNTSSKMCLESAPEPTPIYVSTKSKIAYLTNPVDLKMFWEIPILPYAIPSNGVIKKQIKFNSKTPEELNIIQERLRKELYYDEYVITHIENPGGRIKFKDIRKITVGISKKDIMSYRGKKKQAFYNCFVMIIRIKIDGLFREFHIKVFNTGKLEIPGVQSDKMFEIVLLNIITILQPFSETILTYKQKSDTVLINSNFNCGFYINREVLYDLLKYKYHIHAIYDPCSYPGIQCKFYFNNDIVLQSGIQITNENKDKYTNITEVSFMIFRTGSVLIVGMCEESVLNIIYDFLTVLLKTEFSKICQNVFGVKHTMLKDKKKKIRKKTINITILPNECNNDIIHVKNKLLEIENTDIIVATNNKTCDDDNKEIKNIKKNDDADDELIIEINTTKKQRRPRTTKANKIVK